MTALHQQPTLSALTKAWKLLFKAFLQPIWLLAHGFTAQAAIYLIAIFASVSTLLLSGCSTVRLIDSQVNAFGSAAALPATVRYQFERLPSQNAQPERQTQLETLAEAALAKVGFERVSPTPAVNTTPTASTGSLYLVQLQVRVQETTSAYPPGYALPGRDYVVTGSGRVVPAFGFGLGFGFAGSPRYLRELSIVVRQVGSNAVVFESQASNENPWHDTDAILPAMLDAALQGFPSPPAGVRRVAIDIPR
jgi:hypothetical protein